MRACTRSMASFWAASLSAGIERLRSAVNLFESLHSRKNGGTPVDLSPRETDPVIEIQAQFAARKAGEFHVIRNPNMTDRALGWRILQYNAIALGANGVVHLPPVREFQVRGPDSKMFGMFPCSC